MNTKPVKTSRTAMYPVFESDRKYVYIVYISMALVCFLCSWFWMESGVIHFEELFSQITEPSDRAGLYFLRLSMPMYIAGAFVTQFCSEFRLEIYRFKWNLRYMSSKLCQRIPTLSAIGLGVILSLLIAGIVYGYGMK